MTSSIVSAAQSEEFSRLRELAASLPRPAADFAPRRAMDDIFALGTRIAEGSASEPAHAARTREWHAEIDALCDGLAR